MPPETHEPTNNRIRLWPRRSVRPSPSMVVASLALFVAMTGTAYAASIGSADVIDNSLLSIDLKDGSGIKGIDVVNDTLTGADVQEQTLTGVARKIFYEANAGNDSNARTTIANYAGFSFKATCLFNGTATILFLRETGPSAWLDYYLILSHNSEQFPTSEASSEALRADRDRLGTGIERPVFAFGGPDPNSGTPYMLYVTGAIYNRAQGTAFIYTDTADTLRLDVDAIANNATHKCSIVATVTRAV
jgi:hypothetical protein